MKNQSQFVTATYRVQATHQTAFLHLLNETETLMRSENLITQKPAYRMASVSDPELILEIFEWTDKTSFELAQENSKILEKWAQMELLWTTGGFGLVEFPESSQPWAQFQPLPKDKNQE